MVPEILGQNCLLWGNWLKTERLDSIIRSLDKTWFCMLWKKICKLVGWVNNQISIAKVKIDEFERINLD